MIQKKEIIMASIVFWKLMRHFTKRAMSYLIRTVKRPAGI